MKLIAEGTPEVKLICKERIEISIGGDSILLDVDNVKDFTEQIVSMYHEYLGGGEKTVETVMDMVSDATGYDLVEEYTTTLETQNETIEGLHDEIRDMMEG